MYGAVHDDVHRSTAKSKLPTADRVVTCSNKVK